MVKALVGSSTLNFIPKHKLEDKKRSGNVAGETQWKSMGIKFFVGHTH